MATLKMLNKRVEPNLLIEITLRTGKATTYKYFDAESEKQLDPTKLSPLQKGCVAEYCLMANGEVRVHLPYRSMSRTLRSALKGCKSFRSTGKIRKTHRNLDRSIRNVQSCVQDFLLSETDWKTFRGAISKTGWVTVDKRITVDTLSRYQQVLIKSSASIVDSYKLVYEQARAVKDADQLQETLKRVEDVTTRVQSFRKKSGKLVRLINRSMQERRPLEEKGQIEHRLKTLQQAIDHVNQISTKEAYDLAVYNYRAATGDEGELQRWVRPLGQEFEYLAKDYPALRFLRVCGAELSLPLAGATIRITEEGIRIDGDLAALRQYSKEVVIPDTENKSRFTALVIE